MVFYLFFSYTAFTSGRKAKWKNISTTCGFLLQISQNHSPNCVCPPSKVSHCSSVIRIRHPRRLFIAKGKFLRVLMRWVVFFSTEDKYFLPFGEPRIRGVTVHLTLQTCMLGSKKQWHTSLGTCTYYILYEQISRDLFQWQCIGLWKKIMQVSTGQFYFNSIIFKTVMRDPNE